MKRIIAICLGLLLMCSVAMAAEWPEGKSANKPYTGSPEVDFNETIGYLMLMPLNDSTIKPGELMLSIYTPRTDVKIGEGTLTLHSNEDKQVEEVEFSEENVVVRAMTEEELEALLWGTGTVFEVALKNPLLANRNYYVQMSEGCMISDEYEAVSPEINEKDIWYFNTNTPNYIENMSYYRVAEGAEAAVAADEVKVGDSVRFSICMGGEAVAAVVCCAEGMITPEATYFEGAAETSIQFPQAGQTVWSVVYLDAEGNGIEEIAYTTNVQE